MAMVRILFLTVLSSLAITSYASPNVVKDHLAWTKGAKGFCNLYEALKQLPQVNTRCGAIISIQKEDFTPEDEALGTFGKIQDILDFSDVDGTLAIVTVMTLEQLETIRYDQRILNLAPDFPMGALQ